MHAYVRYEQEESKSTWWNRTRNPRLFDRLCYVLLCVSELCYLMQDVEEGSKTPMISLFKQQPITEQENHIKCKRTSESK